MTRKDPMAMAAVNLTGVLGAIPKLCMLDEPCKAVLAALRKPASLCFSVKDGPCMTLRFSKDGCEAVPGDPDGGAKMTFPTPEAFNDLIDRSKPGFPARKPIQTLTFLAGPFSKITDRLSACLRPTDQELADPDFFEKNTLLTLHVVAGAVAALANTDPIARISAANTVDGAVSLGIRDKEYVTLVVRDSVFSVERKKCDEPRASMEFADTALANGLFAGTVSTVNELCKGNIRIAGMCSMLDNVNRILDRVSVYLA